MFGDRLPRHVEMSTQLGQRLSVVLVQLIEQLSAAFVSQCLEHCVHLGDNMQPFGCMSSGILNCDFTTIGEVLRLPPPA
jgi:hypothetical protein